MFVTQQKDIIIGLAQSGINQMQVFLSYPLMGIISAMETKQDFEDAIYSELIDLHAKLNNPI